MIDLPLSTLFNKRIPKQKFYDNLNVTPELKRVFKDQISVIIWRNKLAESTLNIAKGEQVTELQVFEIRLNQRSLDKRVLELIDREIPYHILFLLTCEELCQAWIGYKEPSLSKAGNFKVNSYYHTEWLQSEEFEVKLEGLDLDAVYENFIRQIAGEQLEEKVENAGLVLSLAESIERMKKKEQLERQILVAKKKVIAEKQFNRQVILNTELKNLQIELEGLDGQTES